MLLLSDRWLHGFDGMGEDRGETDQLLAEPDLSPGDPRDLEQIVDQANEVRDLPVDHLACPADIRVVQALEPQKSGPRCGSAPGDYAARGPASP